MDDKINYESVANIFKKRLESELSGSQSDGLDSDTETRDYDNFKKQYMPKHLTIYESICNFAEKNIPFKPDPKKIPEIKEAINICHLNTTPTGVYSASLVIPLALILFSVIVFFMFPVLVGGTPNTFFVIFSLILGLILMVPLQSLPQTLAGRWRLKASNQMVLAVFYVVTYMRHTSNLELAINFAAEHLGPPLALDMRKVVWDLETQKYDSIKESLEAYLKTWRKWNLEFIESMNLIQSSLYETSNDRRLLTLDKSLQVMLDETFNKMLHYAHNLKGPLTTLNMLGVVLPILTLVILPLVVSFMDGFRWYHLLAMYNIALPAGVFYLGQKILTTRPGGSGKEDITKKNPELKKYKKLSFKIGDQEISINPLYFSLILFLVIFLVGLFPVLWNSAGLPDYGIYKGDLGPRFGNLQFIDSGQIVYRFLDYRERDIQNPGDLVGPFGLGALLLSLFVPLAFGLSAGLYFKFKTTNIIKLRNQSKALELEFAAALFQLGNRIGDGLPAEIAFGKVSQLMEGTISGKFFALVNVNITRLGMSVHKAIFDKQKGALKYYPSDIIESSMKVLVESSKKGPLVASQALTNVADYIQRMHSVDERLNDLMGDIIGSMKSQVKFLTPVISGVVVGITSMITTIIGTLTTKMNNLSNSSPGMGNSSVLSMFGVGVPTYQFQIVVGLYVVQLSYILIVIANGIENGPDKLGEEAALGQSMVKSILLYTTIAFILILIFNVVASSVIAGQG